MYVHVQSVLYVPYVVTRQFEFALLHWTEISVSYGDSEYFIDMSYPFSDFFYKPPRDGAR